MSLDGYPAWPDLFRWLNVLKDRVETVPSISAEQVITGTLDPSTIPPIPWADVLKAGSSLGDLEIRSAGDLSSGTLLAERMPALSGDVSSVAGTATTTLATVNASPGSYGSGSAIPLVTVNGKGLVTLVTEQPIATGALTRVNDTNVTATLGGTPLTALLKDVSITLGWTGTLGLARGGTHADLSATGGASQFLRQNSVGADVTVVRPAVSDLSDGTHVIVDTGTYANPAWITSLAGSKLTGAYTAAGLTLATSRLLGRTAAGSGAAEEISVAGSLSLSGGVLTGTAAGTVTSVSVATANGFAGSSSGGATPALTLSTTITADVLKGNGTALSAATVGTDYSVGTSGLATGILKSTTGTGGLSIAVAGDFPTLNQNTTGSAATLTTPRAINGVNFDGSAAITVTAAAGTLTGGTLAAGVLASSLTNVGTLTGGATGAGFTIALTTSTVTGTLPNARLAAPLSTLGALADASGVLTNDGAGVLSWGAGGSGISAAVAGARVALRR